MCCAPKWTAAARVVRCWLSWYRSAAIDLVPDCKTAFCIVQFLASAWQVASMLVEAIDRHMRKKLIRGDDKMRFDHRRAASPVGIRAFVATASDDVDAHASTCFAVPAKTQRRPKRKPVPVDLR
ncbi:hypothetical protein [Candidatus Accumulibacter sp. ACC003]|uniref:hypothetical protein n=1 Tax=Candidatus Accumulibacter sp. ACC003 TaxID=2823334 RepID=UPI0025BC0FC6|nr:hypothetical protein [Candidatus Accumulibacter sp. ACC003]